MSRFFVCALIFLSVQVFAIEKVVIVGAGPAGLTAAIYAAQAGLSPLVIEGGLNDGELAHNYNIENFPGFPEGIAGECLLERLQIQATGFGARFSKGVLKEARVSQVPFILTLEDGKTLECETVILAMGASPRTLGLSSEKKLLGKGVSYWALNDAATYKNKEVVMVGGGDAALQEALFLALTSSKVTLLVRGPSYTAAAYLQERVKENKKITTLFQATVDDILGEKKVTGIRIAQKGVKRELPTEAVFVAIGRVPNTALFKGKLQMTDEGLIAVKGRSSETSQPGVFAAGDMIDPTYRKAITAAASGCVAAIDAAAHLAR